VGQQRRVLVPERSALDLWGAELRALRDAQGLSLAKLGARVRFDSSYLARMERGQQFPTLTVAQACDQELGASGELVRLWHIADRERQRKTTDVASSPRNVASLLAIPGAGPRLAALPVVNGTAAAGALHAPDGAGSYAERFGDSVASVDTGLDPSRVAEAARQSLEFAAWADQSPVSVMEDVSYELGRIASCYVHRPAGPLFNDLLRLRDITFGMLRRGVPPRQARDMCVLAGTNLILLAHATENLGDPVSAMAQARAAWACADQADHDGLRGWVRGTAALIAEWTGRPAYAAQLAREGQEYAQPAESMVRLAAIEARAQARAGNMPGAMEALDRARRARGTEVGSRDGLLEYGGLLTFPPVKQRYYEGSILVLAGQHAAGETAALEAIGLYGSGPPHERSYGDEAIARVDVISARVAQRDLDGACAAARPVLALPPEQRIEQLADTLSQVTSQLALPPFAASSTARDLAGEIREFTASSSRAALGR
jgi:transcriptional regulator with XRE-family HTH domain